MDSQRKSQTLALLICALLLLSSFDFCESRKTSNSKNKSKSGSSTASRTKVSNTQHANPASFSYSNVAPSAPQPVKPSAPVQKPPYPVQSQHTYSNNQAPPNTRPIGWNVDQNKPVNPPNSPPYPSNVQHNSQFTHQGPPVNPPYPSNIQQNSNSQFMNPQQGLPNAYHPQNTNYNNAPPAYQHPAQAPPPYMQNSPQGYYPQQQQPQIVPQFIPVQQQTNSGPGLVKTALVAGAAGLGGAALYNAFKSDSNNDPKTTVIIVNNTQPIMPVENTPAPSVQAEQPEASNTTVTQVVPIVEPQVVPIVEPQEIVTPSIQMDVTPIPSILTSSEESAKKDDNVAVNATNLMSQPALNTKAQEGSVDVEKLSLTASNGISSISASISLIALSIAYTLF